MNLEEDDDGEVEIKGIKYPKCHYKLSIPDMVWKFCWQQQELRLSMNRFIQKRYLVERTSRILSRTL